MLSRICLALSILVVLTMNYAGDDASAVGYPPALVMKNGDKVTSQSEWESKRRPEIMEHYRRQIYGTCPHADDIVPTLERTETDDTFLDGIARRKRLVVTLQLAHDPKKNVTLDVMLVLPKAASSQNRYPVFLGLNFCGNHGVHPDAKIPLSTRWIPKGHAGVVNNRATEAHRGSQASRWPLEYIISQGYGVATVYYGDIEEDHVDGWKNGVRNLFPVEGKVGDQLPTHGWGAIGAWAWGLSQIMDVLGNIDSIDKKRIYLHGHSRLGKTALWAGALDTRFAMVISNNSGEGGAALARRLLGERTADLNRAFPHWFCKNFHQYSGKESQLPVDQHLLIAAIAPRPVYIASASDDAWADPEGEFLAGVHAEPVYQLYSLKGLGTTNWPGVNQPVGYSIRYHLRQGKHDVTQYDWEQWIAAAKTIQPKK
jgi:hypothetical protein